jgi:hypothetical protein
MASGLPRDPSSVQSVSQMATAGSEDGSRATAARPGDEGGHGTVVPATRGSAGRHCREPELEEVRPIKRSRGGREPRSKPGPSELEEGLSLREESAPAPMPQSPGPDAISPAPGSRWHRSAGALLSGPVLEGEVGPPDGGPTGLPPQVVPDSKVCAVGAPVVCVTVSVTVLSCRGLGCSGLLGRPGRGCDVFSWSTLRPMIRLVCVFCLPPSDPPCNA